MKLNEAYTVKTDTGQPLVERLRFIFEHFNAFPAKQFDYVLIEQPESFMRFGKYSITNVKAIQALMMAIGSIVSALCRNYKVELVRVNDWKGRSNKKVTQLIAKRHTDKKLNEHEADAFVMGLNWQRYLRFEKGCQNG
jgi:hypothetical protein